MAVVALTTIKHGYMQDGQNVELVVPEGEDFPADKFSKEEIEALEASGSIGQPPAEAKAADDEEKKALEARVAELEAELAAAKKSAK